MRLFIAGLETETNTFAPWPTGARAFAEGGLWRGDASAGGDGPENLVARLWRDLAARDGHELIESVFAFAQPSGPTVQAVYEGLRDEILADLRRRGPFDVVLMFLHGAMMATECDDCEADLTGRVRAIAGPGAAIGVELDPHCHLSQALLDAADAVILMKEYPHTDFLPRARELYDLCVATAGKAIRPTSRLFDCRMVGFYPTTTAPMMELLEAMRPAEAARRGCCRSASPTASPGATTPTPDRRCWPSPTAIRIWRRGSPRPWAARPMPEDRPSCPGFPASTRLWTSRSGRPAGWWSPTPPTTPGAGRRATMSPCFAPCCARGIDGRGLRRDLGSDRRRRPAPRPASGARLDLRLGGKCGPASGESLDLTARVRAVRESHDQAGLGDSRVAMGLAVWLEIEGVDVVVNSIRTQVFAPDAFTGLGIDLGGQAPDRGEVQPPFPGAFRAPGRPDHSLRHPRRDPDGLRDPGLP